MTPYEMLNEALDAQFKKNYEGVSRTSVEIGTITSDLGLKVSRFDTPIPKGEYLISRRLSLTYEPQITVTTSAGGEEGHTHTVNIPLTKGIAKVTTGDMVLVNWVGETPIIADVIVSSESM